MISAVAFAASLGVNTHLPYTDGGYANLGNVLADLAYLGIHNVRDSISNGQNGSAPLQSYLSIAESGARFTFLSACGGSQSDATLAATLGLVEQVETAVPGSVVAVEGPNEINNFPLSFDGVGGMQGAVAFQAALFAAVHGGSGLPGVNVDYFTGYDAGGLPLGPDPATTPGLADADNQHPYPAFGQAPYPWVNPLQALPNAAPDFGQAVFTETGYSTNGGTGGAVNNAVQARYILDLLFDNAANGVSTTFLYQLLDAYPPGAPQGDDGYGLFDPSNVAKPAAVAIHNLTTILADAGEADSGPVPYALTGLPPTGNTMLIAKSSGAYDIVVWNEPAIWNAQTGTEIPAGVVKVGVQLGTRYGTVAVFDPIRAATPFRVLQKATRVTIGLRDHPIIVEITP